ncbi:hypothetical protein BTM25_41300 [Actinomadura rubteroloni]|uniref:DUF305 domain-containing protein n=1 Tax=Actinomadura rubteroloni TaxID=1926885 RepID=A0A2P4UK89_9ACTN|nr:DUF305 domain-containing protein [Actinomadura rubteroloni]POM25482.1 hypothetical protein BTM25_41300 [Actinomadura rubteroloni]
MKRVLTTALVPLLAAATLTACGDGDKPSAHPSGHMGGHMAPATTAAHNAQDVMFAQMMIPHHRQAVEMAGLAARRASSPQVKDLASRIAAAQDPEITKMSGWLATWKEPTSMPSMNHGSMDGMMSGQDMKALAELTGKAFDRKFLTMMIEHHRGAVVMAQTEQRSGADPAARALAASIITTQTAEIATMRTLLKAK